MEDNLINERESESPNTPHNNKESSSTVDNSLTSPNIEEASANTESRNKIEDSVNNADNTNINDNHNDSPPKNLKEVFDRMEQDKTNHNEIKSEVHSINFADELKFVKESKEKANKLINTKPDYAVEGYEKILKHIMELFNKVTDQSMFETSPELKEIAEQEKLIMSNLALAYSKFGYYKKAIELDLTIIKIDPKFDKSYARLITSYLHEQDLYQAHIYAQTLRMFKADTVAKYENILSNFDEALRKHDEVF